ncbi:MAG: ribosome silencing factor [Chloroflexi bacterium]|nr:ribosome silencing factor [Chloroflexota bacterium]MYF78921.1 ribosome silencing factor [Chloroflexota bacterium]MYK61003.1 ribosome silencing factor [Chloroflexota bacterium]
MTTSTPETTVKLSIEELARAALEEASSNLGSDVVLLDTRNVSDFTDFFVIASGETERHLEMMADRIERKIRDLGMRRNNREGSGSGGWLLIDFPGFIVHLFNRETRAYYDLEGLWSQANEVVRLQ